MAAEFCLVLPVFAIGLILRLGVFSEYPVTDLFQATHLMKGAQEFGRFDILNPFTADAYIPAIQGIEGLLARYLGFDSLLGAWVVPVLALLPKFLACRAALQSVLRRRESWLFATAAAACFLSVVTPSNGDLVALGSMLLFSLAAGAVQSPRPAGANWLLGAGLIVLAAGYVATRSHPIVFIAAFAVVALLPLYRTSGRNSAWLWAAALLILTLVPLHRSTLLFVPLALVLGMGIPLLNRWLEHAQVSTRAIGAAAGVVTAGATAWAGGLLAWILAHPATDMHEAGFYPWLLDLLLGQHSTEANVMLGSGPKIALFELGRVLSPSFVALAGIGSLLVFVQALRRPAPASAAAGSEALVAWGLAIGLVALVLTGLPFAYRSSFFLILLFAVVLAAAFDALDEAKAQRAYRAMLAMAAVYIGVVIPLAYRCGAVARCVGSEYLERALPFLAPLGAFLLAAAALGAWAPAGRALRYAAKTVMVLLFALEIGVSRAYFMPYTYGAVGGHQDEPVSHLSRAEVGLAGELRRLTHPVILVSDPFTLSNLRALTGLNSLITYSNLDTVAPEDAARLRHWLRETIEPGSTSSRCASAHPLELIDNFANAAEFNYWLARLAFDQLSGSQLLQMFGFKPSFMLMGDGSVTPGQGKNAWVADAVRKISKLRDSDGNGPEILLVIDQKTVDWARGGHVSYFPDVRPLDPGLISSLETRCRAQVHDRRFALVSFPMEKR